MTKEKLIAFSKIWIRVTNIPFAFLGILYLFIYSVEVINSDNEVLVSNLENLSNVIWLVFIVDLLIRFLAVNSVTAFVKNNYIEILAVSLPFLRALRMLRVLLAIRGLKIFVVDRARATGAYVALLAPLTWFTGAIVVLDVESKNSGATINSLGNALWWSLSTITTVGYGDLYPVTISGKVIAAVLMIMGISLFSAGAGMFASWILNDKKTN
jgi:voltage-gated potassium channel